ncbi:MAG: PaaI family thioesterase [Spirochaetales bacterium]|nr:PaaI family thioesterase [Spirochaetales bacterium]
MEQTIINDNNCFCCGENNAQGLHLQFTYPAKGKARTELLIPPHFAGWKNITHGGLLSMLLDEVMAHACGSDDLWALTAELTVRFLKPVSVGESISVEAEITEKKSRLIRTAGIVKNSNGETIAKASARFLAAHSQARKKDAAQ